MGGLSQLGIRAANIALFVSCTYLTAGIVTEVGGQWLSPTATAAAPPAAVSVVDRREWSDRQPILDRNLFGAKLAGEDLPELPNDEPAVQTRLPLKLLGTAAADNSAFSTAAIEDKGSQKHQIVRIGDHLEKHSSVEVVGIERRRVMLRNGAQLEELLLDDKPVPKTSRRRTASNRSSRNRGRPSSRISDRLQKLRERAEQADESPRSASTLFSDARILPKYENGEMVGIQLSAIKSGSMYEKFGFQDGDVITELNGIEINNPAASAKLLSELTQATEFEFKVNGETRTIPADQVAQIMDQL